MALVLEVENATENMKVYYNKIKRKFYKCMCIVYVPPDRVLYWCGMGSFIIHERACGSMRWLIMRRKDGRRQSVENAF